MHMSSAANLFTMVSDMFPKQVVGSVVALGVIFGSLSAMAFAQLTGFIWQTMGNYWPLFLIASSAYLVALAIIHALIPHMTPVEFEAVAKSVPTQSNNQNKL